MYNCWLQLTAENGTPYFLGMKEDGLLIFHIFRKILFLLSEDIKKLGKEILYDLQMGGTIQAGESYSQG